MQLGPEGSVVTIVLLCPLHLSLFCCLGLCGLWLSDRVIKNLGLNPGSVIFISAKNVQEDY